MRLTFDLPSLPSSLSPARAVGRFADVSFGWLKNLGDFGAAVFSRLQQDNLTHMGITNGHQRYRAYDVQTHPWVDCHFKPTPQGTMGELSHVSTSQQTFFPDSAPPLSQGARAAAPSSPNSAPVTASSRPVSAAHTNGMAGAMIGRGTGVARKQIKIDPELKAANLRVTDLKNALDAFGLKQIPRQQAMIDDVMKNLSPDAEALRSSDPWKFESDVAQRTQGSIDKGELKETLRQAGFAIRPNNGKVNDLENNCFLISLLQHRYPNHPPEFIDKAVASYGKTLDLLKLRRQGEPITSGSRAAMALVDMVNREAIERGRPPLSVKVISFSMGMQLDELGPQPTTGEPTPGKPAPREVLIMDYGGHFESIMPVPGLAKAEEAELIKQASQRTRT